MKKPMLVVMAAGMGSRYGGLKQIDPVGPNGEIIIDYSLHDAKKAGFETVIFIIKKEIEKDFKESIQLTFLRSMPRKGSREWYIKDGELKMDEIRTPLKATGKHLLKKKMIKIQ